MLQAADLGGCNGSDNDLRAARMGGGKIMPEAVGRGHGGQSKRHLAPPSTELRPGRALCRSPVIPVTMTAMTQTTDPRRHAPATLRNREAILTVLRDVLPKEGLLLEIASGSGEHAAFMAPQLAPLVWQPSDYEADALPSIDAHAADSGATNIRPALRIDVTAAEWPLAKADVLLCCNMIHIAPWAAAEGLVAGAVRLLDGHDAPFIYGPFKRNGQHTAPSNAAFDDSLKARDPDWGVRCLDGEVAPLAARHGFTRMDVVPMPANNLTVVFRRG